jgi:hypothetical protein
LCKLFKPLTTASLIICISIIEFRFSGWYLEVRGTSDACGDFVRNVIFSFFGQSPGDLLCSLHEDVWEMEVQHHFFLSSVSDENSSFLVYDVYVVLDISEELAAYIVGAFYEVSLEGCNRQCSGHIYRVEGQASNWERTPRRLVCMKIALVG